MAFRILIFGGRQRFDYPRLRDALDTLLANRLPDVEVITAGGPGVPALAACYARSRGLPLFAVPIDHIKHPGHTEEQRDARLVDSADAAVIVGDGSGVRELLDRVKAKGVRLVVVGAVEKRTEPIEVPDPDDGMEMVRGLPDKSGRFTPTHGKSLPNVSDPGSLPGSHRFTMKFSSANFAQVTGRPSDAHLARHLRVSRLIEHPGGLRRTTPFGAT